MIVKDKGKIILSLLFFVVIAFSQSVSVPKLVVFGLEPIGTEDKTAYAITRMLRDEFVKNGKFTVLDAPAEVPVYYAAPACSIAREIGAEKALIGSVLLLGTKYTVSFRVVNVADGLDEFADKISTTILEEMDVVVARIATAVAEGKPIEQTVEVGQVVEPEVPVFKTREPFAAIMFRTGYFFGLYGNAACDMFTLECSVAYETKDILMEALLSSRDGMKANGWYFDLLIHKIFSPKDFSGYFGGGLGMRKIVVENPYYADDALAITASGGLLAFRTYYFRVIANGRLSFNLNSHFAGQPDIGFTFGISSPQLGSRKGAKNNNGCMSDNMCIAGCLGSMVLIGLMLMAGM